MGFIVGSCVFLKENLYNKESCSLGFTKRIIAALTFTISVTKEKLVWEHFDFLVEKPAGVRFLLI